MELIPDVDGREVVPEVAQLYAAIRKRGVTTYESVGADVARKIVRASVKLQGPAPEMPATDELLVGVPVRIYRPAGASSTTLAYLHGGGWVTGDLDVADTPCRQLAEATGCSVASIGYRRGPEHRFPAAHDDAFAAVTALLDGHGPVVLVGDSAGANLAATVAVRVRQALDGLVLLYPPISPMTPPWSGSSLVNAHDPILPASTMAWFWEMYVGPGPAPADARLDPSLAADLAGLPRTLVVTCGLDVLHDEGVRFARILAEAGTEVTEHDQAGLTHGFLWMGAAFPEAVRRTLALVDEWIGHRPNEST